MKFEDALKELRNGKSISSKSFDSEYSLTEQSLRDTFTLRTLLREDWYVIEPQINKKERLIGYVSHTGSILMILEDSEDDRHYATHKNYKRIRMFDQNVEVDE